LLLKTNLVVAHSRLRWCAIPAAAVPQSPFQQVVVTVGEVVVGQSYLALQVVLYVIPVKSNNMHRYNVYVQQL